ncbi:DNA-directed DNA polymerase [Candidatus Nanosalina sp. VS9-1]|uniref:DNA-directed DNA polymerase n=1 Tax=Candidatus Nanosalina sp. VS9-1 TaxID=3388566 RepID=UPI0039E0C084
METDVTVIDADYRIDNGEVLIRAFGKTAAGENILIEDRQLQPYFYAVPNENAEELKEEIESRQFTDDDDEPLEVREIEIQDKKLGLEEVKALKISTDIPANVPKLKYPVSKMQEVKECREFDIPFYKRFLIDRGIRPGETVRVNGEQASGDIERKILLEEVTESDKEEPSFSKLAFDLEVIDEEVVMASFYGEDFEKVLSTGEIDEDFVETFESEKELLQRFMAIIEDRDTDIITGYNTDEFDFGVLRERVQKYGMELSLGRDGERMKYNRRGRFKGARLKGRMHLDLFPFISHVVAPGLDSETLDLDSVAEEMLGENKDEVTFEEMKQWWRDSENLEKFARYNLRDSELAYRLSEELVPQIMELSRITGLIPFDACRLTYGQLTENFLLREAFNRNMLAPNRPTRNERRRRQNQGAYEGGFVYTPDSGLYEDVSVFDFRSLYPTVMVAHNISPEVLDLEDCDEKFTLEEFDFFFCQDEQGFFPELIEGLVGSRYELKEKLKDLEEDSLEYERVYSRQQAQKILANSFYGYLGYDGARWYSKESAQATTYLGREYIEDTIDIAEEMGFEIVYGDTDSVFIQGEDVKERKESFLEKVNSTLPEFMELEFEGYFVRGFFTSKASGEGAKKKYALMDEEGGLKITGFEQVRRDWSPVAKETQKKVLNLVLQDRISEAAEEVKETIEALKNQEMPVERLKIHTTLTKPPEEYGSTAPHVEAVKKARKRGMDIEPETTVDYVVTRGGGGISERAELTKFADNYDPDYYIDNQVVPAAVRVLKVFGYTEDELKGKGRQSGLGRFS